MKGMGKEQLKKEVERSLDYLLKDFRENLEGDEAVYMVERITDFLDAKEDKKISHFHLMCRYMVENSLKYRKITVANIKTAWSDLYDQH